MKKGEIVKIEFTGTEKASGKVFDTTKEEEAKTAGFWNEKSVFRPLTVVVGKGQLLKGLDNALLEMKQGDKKKIVLEPKDAFGERNEELIGIVPMQEFKRRDINPFPGLQIEMNGRQGKVQSVSGGRVRVDFNPEMAGKTVEYEIKILEEVKGKEKQLKALVERFFPIKEEIKAKAQKEEAVIELPVINTQNLGTVKQLCAKEVMEDLGFKKVVFQEVFEEKKKKERKA